MGALQTGRLPDQFPVRNRKLRKRFHWGRLRWQAYRNYFLDKQRRLVHRARGRLPSARTQDGQDHVIRSPCPPPAVLDGIERAPAR